MRNARATLLPTKHIIGLYEGCKPLVCQDSILLAFYLQQSDHAPIQLSALFKAPVAGVYVMAPVARSYAVRPSERPNSEESLCLCAAIPSEPFEHTLSKNRVADPRL